LLVGIDQAVTTLQAKWLGNLGSTPCRGRVIFHGIKFGSVTHAASYSISKVG